MTQTLHLPNPDAPFALLREMAETPALLRHFDTARTAHWRKVLAHHRALFITGEGSSRIFPAKNLIDRASHNGTDFTLSTEGARQGMEYSHNNSMIIGMSNSGRTRETVDALHHFRAQGIDTYAITGGAQSPLTDVAADSLILSCGAEAAVAASKTVVEQALLLQSLLGGTEWPRQAQAADAAEHVFSTPVGSDIIDALAAAETIYVAGRNNGVAEEIALKSCEITRRKSIYLEGTYVLHGIEEVMATQECVLLIDPYPVEMARYQSVLSQGIGINVIAISSSPTPFPTLHIPTCAGFDNYLQLMAGWMLLTGAAQRRGIDMDKTTRARKVGNAVELQ